MRELLAGKRKAVFSVVAAVIAVTAALGAGIWLRAEQNKREASNPKTAALADTLSAETKKAQELAQSGKTDEANKYINAELAKGNLTAKQKYDLYLQQGLVADNQDDQQKALNSYYKAEAAKQTNEVSGLIAAAAEKLGKKDVAVTYYKKAISQLDKNSALYEDNKAALEQRVRDLGGQL